MHITPLRILQEILRNPLQYFLQKFLGNSFSLFIIPKDIPLFLRRGLDACGANALSRVKRDISGDSFIKEVG